MRRRLSGGKLTIMASFTIGGQLFKTLVAVTTLTLNNVMCAGQRETGAQVIEGGRVSGKGIVVGR